MDAHRFPVLMANETTGTRRITPMPYDRESAQCVIAELVDALADHPELNTVTAGLATPAVGLVADVVEEITHDQLAVTFENGTRWTLNRAAANLIDPDLHRRVLGTLAWLGRHSWTPYPVVA